MLIALRYIIKSISSHILLLFVLILFIQGLLPGLNIYLTGYLISAFSAGSEMNSQIVLVVAIWCLSLYGPQFLHPLIGLFAGEVTSLSSRYFNQAIVHTINSARSLTIFEDKNRFETLEVLRNETSHRPHNFIINFAYTFRPLVVSISVLGVLIHYSGIGLAICVLAVLPTLMINFKQQQRMWMTVMRGAKETVFMKYIVDICTQKGITQEIKLFGLGDYLLSKYSQAAIRLQAMLRKQRLWSLLVPLPVMLLSYGLLFYGVYTFLAGMHSQAFNASQIVMVFQSIALLKTELDSVSTHSAMLIGCKGFFESFHSFVTGYKEPVAEGTRLIPEKVPLDITFNQVRFIYPDKNKEVLKGISMHIPAGQKLAILGTNGGGKTTLIKLLLRMYEMTAGDILVNGVSLRDWQLASYRSRISSVVQDFGKYEFTIAENILFDQSDNPSNVDSLLDTVELKLPATQQLGKRFGGIDLSGGQWQKLSIARALHRDAGLFVFDEFSAALDPVIEYKLFNEILNLPSTVIAVTHRLGKIKSFDRIVVISDGVIAEDGDYATLMALKGEFYAMWQAQFGAMQASA